MYYTEPKPKNKKWGGLATKLLTAIGGAFCPEPGTEPPKSHIRPGHSSLAAWV